MGVPGDLPESGLGIRPQPNLKARQFKSKDTDGLLQKNGQNHCRPSVPDKHPHACFITRTLNEVLPKLRAEGV